jgi:hypothetical protein
VRSRVITSPRHVKRLIAALQDNLARYERTHGAVEGEHPKPAPDGGKVH